MLMHTSPKSIGVTRPSKDRSASSGRSASASVEVYASKTSESKARVTRVLSTPKMTSAVGAPAARMAPATIDPASPPDTNSKVTPVDASKSAMTSSLSANESWVSS